MVEPRLCEVCSSEIPKWKSKGTTVCSIGCRFKRKDQKRQKVQEEKRKAAQKDFVIFHNCLYYGSVDPFVARCLCRKRVTVEQAEELVRRGDALDLETRTPFFTGGSIIQIGKVKRTPRVPTLEKPHCERITEKPKRSIKRKEKTTEELKAAVEEDRAERFEEEKLRMEIYNELTKETRKAWLVNVPEEEWYAAERRDWGRPIFTNFKDDRTPGGIGIDVDRILGEINNHE